MDLPGIRYGLLIKILHHFQMILMENPALTCCSNHQKMIWRYGHIGAGFFSIISPQCVFWNLLNENILSTVVNYFFQLRVSAKGVFGSRWPFDYDISHQECESQAFQFLLCVSYIFLHFWYKVCLLFQHFQDLLHMSFWSFSNCNENKILE